MKPTSPLPPVTALVAVTVLFTLLHGVSLRAATPESESVDFNFHIRPLLSDRCFACHGPDDKARKAKLGLHSREAALQGGKSGEPSLTPGNPDQSEILRRLTSSDPDEVMPPPESKLPPLSAAEIERVRTWIRQGAHYKEHWAFLPISTPAVPDSGPSNSSTTPAHAIDGFIRARLQPAGLAQQPEATRETLLRRLSLDLIGLPPTRAEIDAFLTDSSPNAYESQVDRLLNSPHYGERMAQEWLDLSRYADTYGYQSDVDRDLSPWRDWVVRALNENLPWNEFITWQLAGDLLPNATHDQVLATAFNRLHRQTNEGGSIEEEFRAEYVADRVHTMGTAFMGLTLECARCHDHKYDPISQKDYYRLAGFFNSIDESGLYSHFTRATPTPVLLLWDDATRSKSAEAKRRAAEIENQLAQRREAARRSDLPTFPTLPIPPQPVAHLPLEQVVTNRTPDLASTNLAQLSDSPTLAPGAVGTAMLFSGDNTVTLPKAGRFSRTDPFSVALWLKPTEKQNRAILFHASIAWTDSGSRGYECVLDEGRPFFGLIHFWPGNAVAVRAKSALPLQKWSHLTVTYDGSSRAAGIRLYQNGEPLEVEVVRDHLYKDILHRADWGDSDGGGVPLKLAGRFRDSGFKNGLIDEFQVFDTELTALEVIANSRATDAGRDLPLPPSLARRGAEWHLEHSLARNDLAFQESTHALREARILENSLVTPVREIMAMSELPEARPTFVLRRGAYDAPGERVSAGVPERIAPMAADLPRNRLGLAQWLTSPDHPLTARVAVNRIWKLHFGRGLVGTTWDFGAQGSLPTHPELLDWLSRHYIASGWNRKALHKLIVMSATYRQVSTAPASLVGRDPENLLLARGPKHRLEAEQIRDSALAASGLLVPKLGGPSVKPYQSPGVWEDAGTGKSYTQDKGDNLYRRSLYTFWRRTAPPPSMLTFDATTREVCTAKRETTSTPLQALVLLNDTQFLEAARILAENLVALHPTSPDLRARDAFRSLTGRVPDDRELQVLQRLFLEQLAFFQAHPDAAKKALSVGEKPRLETLPAPDVAATAVLASAVMNHDEFVMKR